MYDLLLVFMAALTPANARVVFRSAIKMVNKKMAEE
jgi:hypothetical protein